MAFPGTLADEKQNQNLGFQAKIWTILLVFGPFRQDLGYNGWTPKEAKPREWGRGVSERRWMGKRTDSLCPKGCH